MHLLTVAMTLITMINGAHAPEPVAGLTARDLAGKRVIFLGDSITQAGLYVSIIETTLQRKFPTAKFDVINLGLASETTSGLSEDGHAGGAFPRPCVHERLGRILDKTKPQVVFACYGMNDGIYLGPDKERMAAYQNGITKLVEQAKAAGARVVLITPAFFDAARMSSAHPGYDDVLGSFAEWIMRSKFKDTLKIDLHTAMKAALLERQKTDPNFHFAGDGVHPGELGHLIIAQTVLRGLGVAVPKGEMESEMARIKADPIFGLVDRRRGERGSAWMSYIGYTRERTVPGGGDITGPEEKAAAQQKEIDALRGKAGQ